MQVRKRNRSSRAYPLEIAQTFNPALADGVALCSCDPVRVAEGRVSGVVEHAVVVAVYGTAFFAAGVDLLRGF